ncbi:MAG TPA: HAD family hydrolase [Acidimicrobiales bacterium]|nr:HAD family hydrolase [Acidimicrobiales bacterium]
MTPPGQERADGSRAGLEAAFFDLDKTVIAKAAMSAFRGALYAEGMLSRRAIVRAVFTHLVYLHLGANEERLSRIRESLLKVTKGWERDKVVAVVEETIEEALEPIIYAEAMDLIDLHHDLGRLVVIVSASPEEIVRPLGRHLGVDETIASRAAVDDEGRYTGTMAFYAYGPYKAVAMHELAERLGIDLAASFAYTDSYTDLPMLEAVGHPVAVNPDRVLARLARERGWEVRNFVRPVRARDASREPGRPRRLPIAASVGGLALVLSVIGWLASGARGAAAVGAAARRWLDRAAAATARS